MACAALRAAGFKVGLYSSPHLVDVRERMVVDDTPITEEAFVSWTEQLRDRIEETEASFFEATTAIAFADFASRAVDVAVVEVGLGGRLDSTNVLNAIASVVTNVGTDHMEYLGDTLVEIAREKAGIAKAGVPFVIGEASAEIGDLLESLASEAGADPVRVSPVSTYSGRLALAGQHQRRNAAVAQELLRALSDQFRPRSEAVRNGFACAWLPGRFDRRGKWLFDVAHNDEGIRALVEMLETCSLERPVHALVGILADKNWHAMLDTLARVVDALWLTIPPSAPQHRRWDPETAQLRSFEPLVCIEPDFDSALRHVQYSAATVVVTGSFHTVGDAMARLPGFAPLG